MGMNRKTNTILFILVAILFNIIVFLILFGALMALYMMVVYPYLLSEAGMNSFATPILVVVFVTAVVIAFLIYRTVINTLFKNIDMDQYFDPLFVKK
jgi:hypothetical protein